VSVEALLSRLSSEDKGIRTTIRWAFGSDVCDVCDVCGVMSSSVCIRVPPAYAVLSLLVCGVVCAVIFNRRADVCVYVCVCVLCSATEAETVVCVCVCVAATHQRTGRARRNEVQLHWSNTSVRMYTYIQHRDGRIGETLMECVC